MERWLFVAQRLTALLLAPLVVAHLALILYAVEGGLTAGEILARTRGSVFWGGFYGLFVLAAAVHGPIGLRAILREWTPLPPALVNLAAFGAGLLLLALGWRAVAAVL